MTPGVEITGDEVGVQIIGGRDIVVSNPDAGFSITYRKDGVAPMLVAIDGIGRSSEPSRVKFWAQAWKVAHRKALLDGLAALLIDLAGRLPRESPGRGFSFPACHGIAILGGVRLSALHIDVCGHHSRGPRCAAHSRRGFFPSMRKNT